MNLKPSRPGVKLRMAVEVLAETATGFDDGLQRAAVQEGGVRGGRLIGWRRVIADDSIEWSPPNPMKPAIFCRQRHFDARAPGFAGWMAWRLAVLVATLFGFQAPLLAAPPESPFAALPASPLAAAPASPLAALPAFARLPTPDAAAEPATTSAALPASVQAALKTAQIPPEAVAVVVEKLDEPGRGRRPFAENAATPMNPASVIKLFTTGAALDLLGPASTWRTELNAARPPRQGVVDGALYWRGSGDPKLNLQQFWLLLRQLRLRGVREIRGDLIVDRSLFALPAHDPAAFDGEPLRPYNAGADAALLNFNALRLLLVPGAGDLAALLETPLAGLRLVERVQLTAGDCGDWRERLETRVDGRTIVLSGRYARACGEKVLNLAPFADGRVLADGLFRTLWRELGGVWRGRVVDGAAPAETVNLAAIESPPLAEVVRDVNKFSNNVMARQVFLALSADTPPADYQKSADKVRAWLAAKGIAAPELFIDNGSGLSRQDRASAETLTATLRAIWRGPTMPEFIASLPVFGEDGTLKKRGNGARAGRAHLKTGYLDGVRALAGYVLDADGQRWSLVAVINHTNARQGKEALDALVEAVLAGAGRI